MLNHVGAQRNAASSNEVRVAVLGRQKSSQRFSTQRWNLFDLASSHFLNASQFETKLISSADNTRMPSKSFRVQRVVIIPFPAILRRLRYRFVAGAPEFVSRVAVGQILADVIGANGSFAMAAIDQHRQLDAGGASERIDGVHCRANGAPSVKNIIDNDDRAILKWQGSFDARTTVTPGACPTSSRCIATSMTPVSISALAISRVNPAIRRAISTPRAGIPTSTTSSSRGFRSMISCAIRRSA